MVGAESNFDVDISHEKAYKKIKSRMTKWWFCSSRTQQKGLGNRGVRVPGSTKLSNQTAGQGESKHHFFIALVLRSA